MSFEREVLFSLVPRRALAVAALLLAAQALCLAQGTPVTSGPRVDPAVERIRDEQQRQMALRSGGRREDPHADERTVKAAVDQLNADFKRVQVIRNELARAVTSGGVLDFKRLSDDAAEVHKRSQRMQTYLALREEADLAKQQKQEDKGDAPAYDEKRLRDSLVRLCRRIDDFVANPRFKSPDVVNVEANTKAARDLREIIALSREIKGGAERLGRAAR